MPSSARCAALWLRNCMVVEPSASFNQAFGCDCDEHFLPELLMEPFSFFVWLQRALHEIRSGRHRLPQYATFGPTPVQIKRPSAGSVYKFYYEITFGLTFPSDDLDEMDKYIIRLDIIQRTRLSRPAACVLED